VLSPLWGSSDGEGVGVDVDMDDAVGVEAVVADNDILDVDVDVAFGNDTVAATLYIFVAVVGTADHCEGAIAEKVSFVVVPLHPPSPQHAHRSEEVLYVSQVHKFDADWTLACAALCRGATHCM
jgi:hypothetical protein